MTGCPIVLSLGMGYCSKCWYWSIVPSVGTGLVGQWTGMGWDINHPKFRDTRGPVPWNNQDGLIPRFLKPC